MMLSWLPQVEVWAFHGSGAAVLAVVVFEVPLALLLLRYADGLGFSFTHGSWCSCFLCSWWFMHGVIFHVFGAHGVSCRGTCPCPCPCWFMLGVHVHVHGVMVVHGGSYSRRFIAVHGGSLLFMAVHGVHVSRVHGGSWCYMFFWGTWWFMRYISMTMVVHVSRVHGGSWSYMFLWGTWWFMRYISMTMVVHVSCAHGGSCFLCSWNFLPKHVFT